MVASGGVLDGRVNTHDLRVGLLNGAGERPEKVAVRVRGTEGKVAVPATSRARCSMREMANATVQTA